MSRITLLAVTHMRTGVCIGGIAEDGRWVRPVKEHGTLLLGDITYATREVMRAFDVVDFPVLRPRPTPPHVEDHVADFVRARPRLAGRLGPKERAAFLAAHAEGSAAPVLGGHRRSLCLVRAASLAAIFFLDAYTGKCEARLEVDGGRSLPVTDLRWRALGRRLLGAQGGERRLPPAELSALLRADEVYVAYGLSRSFEGQLWPLIVGVHPVPDFEVTVDYRNL